MTDHVKLTINGIVAFESGAPSIPVPTPVPTPPPPPPPPPPVTGSRPPVPVAVTVAGDLSGTNGNPLQYYGVLANQILSYRYAVTGQFISFRAGGIPGGNPSDTWVWLSANPGGLPINGYTQFSGNNVAVIEVFAKDLQGYPVVYFNEQPSGPCNRFAQVNRVDAAPGR